MIEAAIIGRPVFSLTDEFSSTQEGTIHFHYLLPENGGFLRIAPTIEEHARQLSECLRHPETARAETQRFVASFIRPHGIDRPATPIFVDTIERLGAAAAPRPISTPLWAYAVRPLVLAGALVQDVATWFGADPGRSRVRNAVHRARKTVHRRGKDIRKATTVASSRVKRRAKLAGKQWQKTVVKPLRARR
jgi:hypothetical protein